MALADGGGGEANVVKVVEESSTAEEISPLVVGDGANNKPPRMTIFSVSYPTEKAPKELTFGATDPDIAFLNQTFSWIWSGSRHSGLLCMASSSIIYFIMDVLRDIFPGGSFVTEFDAIVTTHPQPLILSDVVLVRSISVYQTIFTRCTILLIISLIWLRKTGHPVLIPTHTRNILVTRSLAGFVSLLSFIYSVQNLPVSHAVLLNFATPIMASIGAMVILQEKLPISHIGGLTCSFLGLLLIVHPMHILRGSSTETVQMGNTVTGEGKDAIPFMLVGIFSTTLGGLSYCLISAGAKAADQPVYTVLSFAMLASPLSAICILIFQEFVLPNLFTSLLMIVLGVLAFFAEMFLARGLQLEKIARVTNVLYIKVLLSQGWSMISGAAPSVSELIGCLLILASVCGTAYFGPGKENE